jgi:4-hydroxy-tetrahydrodipicolinate synthase
VFTGSAVALVTPFLDDQLNIPVLQDLLRFHLAHGNDAIVVCGTTGECPTLSREERQTLLSTTLDTVQGEVPVIMGTGCYNTAEAIQNTRDAENIGADGVLVVTPYYNKCSQSGALLHYQAIAAATKLPIIPYNVPSRTGFNLLPATLAQLAKLDNIVAVKEATGNIAQVAEVARLCGEDLIIYSGCDEIVVPLLSLGGQGVISTGANVAPRQFSRMVHAFLEGNIVESRNLQLHLKPLIDALFLDVNPICVKPAVAMLGFDVGPPRLPLSAPSTEHLDIVRSMVEAICSTNE